MSDLIKQTKEYVDLSEVVTATYYDEEHEEWSIKTITIKDVLDAVCDDYTVFTSAQQWIPTSERLPKKDGYYLISIPSGVFPEGILQVDMVVFLDGKWQYQYDFKKKRFEELDYPVLAWMPLPEPYRRDK